MSDLLQNWLNNDVGLSVNITNFERDFANGYLFGEILHKLRQQDDFEVFENRQAYEAKMANFQLLEPTFKALNIKFNAQQANAIMSGERGASLRVLYQLKMAADRLTMACDAAVPMSEQTRGGAPVGSSLTKGICIAREKFEGHERRFFEHRLRSTCVNVKQVREAALLKRFEAEKDKQEIIAMELDEVENATKLEQRDIHRFGMLERMRQNRMAKDEWDSISHQLWRKNMQVRKAREKREVDYEGRVLMKQTMKTQTMRTNASAEVSRGIDVFEDGLEDLGLRHTSDKARSLDDSSDGDEDSENDAQRLLHGTTQVANQKDLVEALQTRLPNAQELEQEANLFLQKIKESKHAGSIARKERERRRRRVLVDQQREQETLQEKKMEEMLLHKINRESMEEKKIGYTVWRTKQYEEIIVQNRQLRQQDYVARRKLDLQEALRRDEDLRQEMLESICEQQEREQVRYRVRERGRLAAHSHRIAQESDSILDLLGRIAIAALEQEQLTDRPEVDDELWSEWMALFIEGIPVDSLPKPQSASQEFPLTSDPPLQEHEHGSPGAALDQAELRDYLTVRGQWALPPPSDWEELPGASPPPEPGKAAAAQQAAAAGAPSKGSSAGGTSAASASPLETEATQAKAPPQEELAPHLQQELQKAVDEEPQPRLSFVERLERHVDIVDGRPVNYRLAMIVAGMLERAFAKPPSPDLPPMPDVPIKLVFAGKPFTGKKIAAARLAEAYNLQVLCVDDLVRECLALSKRPDPLSKNPLEALQVNKMLVDDACASHADAGNPYMKELQAIGYQLQDLLDKGEAIGTLLYVHMVVTKIRSVFPEFMPKPKPVPDTSRPATGADGENADESAASGTPQGSSRRSSGGHGPEAPAEAGKAIDEEGAGSEWHDAATAGDADAHGEEVAATPLGDPQDAAQLNEPPEMLPDYEQGGLQASNTVGLHEAMALDVNDGDLHAALQDFPAAEFEEPDELQSRGWILVGFPDTAEAFKLFERFMAGWVAPSSCPPTEVELKKAEVELLIPPPPKEPPPFALVPGGYDLYVRFDVPNDELIRRALGRRQDPHTSLMYHLEDNVPCFKNQVIYERLELVDDSAAADGTLTHRLHDFDIGQGEVEELLGYFGPFPDVPRLAAVDAAGNFDVVYDSVEEHVAMLLDRKRTLHNKMLAEQRAAEEEAARAAAQAAAEAEAAAAAAAAAEAERLRLEAEEAAAAEAEKEREASAPEKKGKAAKAEKEKAEKEKAEKEKAEKEKEKAEKAAAEEKAATPGLPDAEPTEEPLVPVVLTDLPDIAKKIDGDTFAGLLGQWTGLHQTFLTQAGILFRWHRTFLHDFRLGIYNMQQHFLQFVQRPDDKQELVDAFIANFNSFSDEYPDMRKQDTTKEELHQRADDLHEQLQIKVTTSKEQNTTEFDSLVQKRWVESQLEILAQQIQHAVVLEVRRYHEACQLLADFYQAAIEHSRPQTQPEVDEKGEPLSPTPLPPPKRFSPTRVMPEIDVLVKDSETGATAHKVREPKEVEPATHSGGPAAPEDIAKDQWTFPFLEALMKQARTAIWPLTEFGPIAEAREEAEQPKPKAKGRGSPPPDKKNKDREQESPPPPPKPADPLFVDMEQALLAERLHFTHRLVALQAWAEQRLKGACSISAALFLQLKDCIYLRQRKELDAVNGLIDIIKEHIENEEWITTTLTFEGAHLHLHPNIRLYPEVVPPTPPPEWPEDQEEEESPKRPSVGEIAMA